MEDYLDRISKIADKEGITISKLESIIGASKNVLHKPIKNKTDIQTKWILRIAENFPQYNLDWILLGRGEMYVDSSKEKQSNVVMFDKFNSELLDRIAEKQELIDAQKELIELQRERIQLLEDEKKKSLEYGKLVAEPEVELKEKK